MWFESRWIGSHPEVGKNERQLEFSRKLPNFRCHRKNGGRSPAWKELPQDRKPRYKDTPHSACAVLDVSYVRTVKTVRFSPHSSVAHRLLCRTPCTCWTGGTRQSTVCVLVCRWSDRPRSSRRASGSPFSQGGWSLPLTCLAGLAAFAWSLGAREVHWYSHYSARLWDPRRAVLGSPVPGWYNSLLLWLSFGTFLLPRSATPRTCCFCFLRLIFNSANLSKFKIQYNT